MPPCTLHLLTLSPPWTPSSLISSLRNDHNRQIVVASRPRQTIVPPTILDSTTLTSNWDLLLLIQSLPSSSDPPIPNALKSAIQAEYRVNVGIPSRLLSTYDANDAALKRTPPPPLTGTLDAFLSANGAPQPSSQNLELSPDLLRFMDTLPKTHPGPVTMLNLLHFNHPDGKKSYAEYGKAFVPVARKRGGTAKLVGNVVPPRDESSVDSRGRPDRPGEEWWNEISIVHYPSIRHFCDMLAGEDYQAVNARHRLQVFFLFLLLFIVLSASNRGVNMCYASGFEGYFPPVYD